MLSLFCTHYSSLQHALSLLSHQVLHRFLGNSFQQQIFPFLWIPELPLCLIHRNSWLTNSQQLCSCSRLNSYTPLRKVVCTQTEQNYHPAMINTLLIVQQQLISTRCTCHFVCAHVCIWGGVCIDLQSLLLNYRSIIFQRPFSTISNQGLAFLYQAHYLFTIWHMKRSSYCPLHVFHYFSS